MKMQILLIFLSAMFVLTGHAQEQPNKGFELTGVIKGLGNSKIIVLKFVNGGVEIDSIFSENNSFNYKGKVKEPYFVQLIVQKTDSQSGKLTEFMIENFNISIVGNSIEYDSVKVTGSNSDQILKKYLEEDEALNEQWSVLKKEYDLAVESNDSTQRKVLATKLNKILKEDRVNLLKSYVEKNSNSMVGALIPAFCTIQEALTNDDYQEIYDALSEHIKASDYGQNILGLATNDSE